MKHTALVRVTAACPTSERGREALARRVAEAHAELIISRIQTLNCPDAQKRAVLESVIQSVRERGGAP